MAILCYLQKMFLLDSGFSCRVWIEEGASEQDLFWIGHRPLDVLTKVLEGEFISQCVDHISGLLDLAHDPTRNME